MKIAITGHRPNKLGNDYDLKSTLIKKIKHHILGILIQYSSSTAYLFKTEDPNETVELSDVTIDDITLITGMALGIDTLFAQIAIEYNIPFIAAIPFKEQELKWTPKSQKIYHEILSKAYKIVNCKTNIGLYSYYEYALSNVDDYNPQLMQNRNKWMVDNCDILIAVWDGSAGGTKNCVDYAVSKKRKIIYINPKDFQ